MLSFLYLIIATAVGWLITGIFITPSGDAKLNLIWVRLASSFGVGVLILTWPLYLTAYILHVVWANASPLGPANAIVLGAAIVILALAFFSGRVTEEHAGLITDRSLFRKEAVFYLLVLAFVWFTFHYVLHMEGTDLKMGFTVFSDYAPNVALIRSFSWFANYPTEYPFYAGQDIKYHFMFMFFTGNMEYLGLPLSFAYNLTSTLSLFGFFIMLTQLALRMTGRFAAAVLTAFLFTFRSGLAFFLFIGEHLKAGDLAHALLTNNVFIGYTPNENWGLWNYNVYLNQRHLGFGLIIATTVIWYFYGYVEEACGERKSATSTDADTLPEHTVAGDTGAENPPVSTGTFAISDWFRNFIFSKEAWLPKAPDIALVTGIILGLCSFWNGACVIGGLLILAGFAIFSKNKSDFLILAVTSVLIASLQTKAFIYGSAVSPAFCWGFISEDKSLPGVIGYLTEVGGLTIMGGLFALFIVGRKQRVLIAAFWLPVIFSFTMSLTPDVTVNHKYIMMAMAYLSIIWADIVVSMFSDKEGRPIGPRNIGGKVIACIIAFLLMATGFYDYIIIIRNNDAGHRYGVNTASELTAYVHENFTDEDLILSDMHSVSELTVSGCRLYTGWPYYAWSAGYDTDTRCAAAMQMYTSMSPDELRETLELEGITYVLYEEGMTYDGVPTDEGPIAEVCDLVFTSSDGYYRLYKVRK